MAQDKISRAEAAALASRHGITEDQARELLARHGTDGFEEALKSLAHFLRAPS
jgi:hypothetical protein